MACRRDAGPTWRLVRTPHRRLLPRRPGKSELTFAPFGASPALPPGTSPPRVRLPCDARRRARCYTGGCAVGRGGMQAVRLGRRARRRLARGAARPDRRLPRPERRRQDDGDAQRVRPRRARRGRGALGRPSRRPGGAAALRLHARGARPLSEDAGGRAARVPRRAARPRPAGRGRAPRTRGSSGSVSASAPTATVEKLSHGNQQRVQLAAALVHEPDLLVLDEPFSGLDPVAVETLGEVLRAEAARGAGVLFSSHQLDLVEDLCEDVTIVAAGRVVASGRVARAAGARRARADRRRARRRAGRTGRRPWPAASCSSGGTARCACSRARTSTPTRCSRRRARPARCARSRSARRRWPSSSSRRCRR